MENSRRGIEEKLPGYYGDHHRVVAMFDKAESEREADPELAAEYYRRVVCVLAKMSHMWGLKKKKTGYPLNETFAGGLFDVRADMEVTSHIIKEMEGEIRNE